MEKRVKFRLREVLQSQGKTAMDVVKNTTVGQTLIYQIHRNAAHDVRLSDLLKIASYLDVPWTDLIEIVDSGTYMHDDVRIESRIGLGA